MEWRLSRFGKELFMCTYVYVYEFMHMGSIRYYEGAEGNSYYYILIIHYNSTLPHIIRWRRHRPQLLLLGAADLHSHQRMFICIWTILWNSAIKCGKETESENLPNNSMKPSTHKNQNPRSYEGLHVIYVSDIKKINNRFTFWFRSYTHCANLKRSNNSSFGLVQYIN